MSYKLKNKSEGVSTTTINRYKDGPCKGFSLIADDFIDSDEIYCRVLNSRFKDDPGFAFCRINLKDLSIMGCEDETLKLTEEQYKQVIDSLYEESTILEGTGCISWNYILDAINSSKDPENNVYFKIPEKIHYNYTYTKEE